jgi:hypothetical protein
METMINILRILKISERKSTIQMMTGGQCGSKDSVS